MTFWLKLFLVTSAASLLEATPGSLTDCIVTRNPRRISCHCRQMTHKICENSKGKVNFLNSQKRKLDLRCCTYNFGTESLAREPLLLQIVSSYFARKVGGKNATKNFAKSNKSVETIKKFRCLGKSAKWEHNLGRKKKHLRKNTAVASTDFQLRRKVNKETNNELRRFCQQVFVSESLTNWLFPLEFSQILCVSCRQWQLIRLGFLATLHSVKISCVKTFF